MGVGRRRFQRLSRVALKCPAARAAQRIGAALTLIEHEWQLAQGSPDKRVIIEIGPSFIRTIR